MRLGRNNPFVLKGLSMKTLYFEDSASNTKVFIDADTAELIPVVKDANESIKVLEGIKSRLWNEYLESDDDKKDKIMIEVDIIDNCLQSIKSIKR